MDFRKECEKQGHIARFTWANNLYWIVNPRYHWNGRFIPKPIHALFSEKESA
ncbi:MAG: hypothetical protein GWN81_13545 [Phycisphaerae bacterium]|nr:hypothetical protein [Phycisphaerae bacterium]